MGWWIRKKTKTKLRDLNLLSVAVDMSDWKPTKEDRCDTNLKISYICGEDSYLTTPVLSLIQTFLKTGDNNILTKLSTMEPFIKFMPSEYDIDKSTDSYIDFDRKKIVKNSV